MSIMQERIGPVPVPVLIGGVALGLVLTVMRKKSAPTLAASAPVLPVGAGDGQGFGIGNFPTPNTSTTPPITTNDEWSRQAQMALLGMGYDGTTVSNSLAKYLSGGTLNQQENAIVNKALSLVGPAPTAPQPVTVLPPTTIQQPPPPPATQPNGFTVHPAPEVLGTSTHTQDVLHQGSKYGNRGTTTVGPGETWSQIASRIYGDWSVWPAIFTANKDRLGGLPENLSQGQELWLPYDPYALPGWAGFGIANSPWAAA